jgi:hypothetical protein
LMLVASIFQGSWEKTTTVDNNKKRSSNRFIAAIIFTNIEVTCLLQLGALKIRTLVYRKMNC